MICLVKNSLQKPFFGLISGSTTGAMMGDRRATLIVFLLLCSLLVSLPNIEAGETVEDFWVKMSDIPTGMQYCGVAVVDGKIYVIDDSFTYEYDPETGTWTSKTPMPTARNGFGTAVYQNKIYVISGRSSFWGCSRANEVYDPVTDSWENKTPIPTGRTSLQANVVDGKIYLIGGAKPSGARFYMGAVDLNEVYDPATDSWTEMESMHTAVKCYASAVLDDKIYIMGGQLGAYPFPNSTLNFVQVFDPKTNQWSLPARMPINVRCAAAVATSGTYAPKRIYVVGGDTANEGKQNQYGAYEKIATDVNQVYDPLTDRWPLGAPMFSARLELVIANVNDTLYAIGGESLNDENKWDYSYANEKYTPIGYIPEFPSWTPLLIMLVAVVTVAIFYRRSLHKGLGD
jgi:N-acetylneuraminic acid mutarotase